MESFRSELRELAKALALMLAFGIGVVSVAGMVARVAIWWGM